MQRGQAQMLDTYARATRDWADVCGLHLREHGHLLPYGTLRILAGFVAAARRVLPADHVVTCYVQERRGKRRERKVV